MSSRAGPTSCAMGGRLLAALLMLLLCLGAPACSREQRVERKFAQAHGALREGRPTEAASLYYEAYEIAPEGPRAAEALFSYAQTAEVHQKSPALAAEVYRRLIRLFPQNPLGPQALERAAWLERKELGHPERALLDYNRLLDLYPDSPRRQQWLLATAECYVQMGNSVQAETEVRALLKNRDALGVELRAHSEALLGKVLMLQDRVGEAVGVLEELSAWLAELPDRHAAWLEARFDLAQALSETDQTDRALRVYREIEGEFPRQEVIQEKINFLTIRKTLRRR